MARTRTTNNGRIVKDSGPCNAVPSTAQDSSAVADNPGLDETATTSANLGVYHTNADKASEQSEAQKTDSNQQVVDVDETSRLVKEDMPSQSMKSFFKNLSATKFSYNNLPYGDLEAMLKLWRAAREIDRQEREEKEERECKARAEERKAREEKEEKQREQEHQDRERERLFKEEQERKERERERQEDKEREERERELKEHKERIRKENQEYEERERKLKEHKERIRKKNQEYEERQREQRYFEFMERMKRLFGIESAEEKTVTTTTSEIKSEPEIKPEESIMSEKASELESFQSDLDSKDSPWDGPQDNVLVRDMAIDSAENMANEYAENVCGEAMDAFTSMDDSLDSNLILVGGNRSTPEPESRLDATMSENPSASGPSWMFKSPESGENSGNSNFESHIIGAQLCDDFFRDSLPMVFSAKNRSVAVTKVGVVQYFGENSASFSATQCFIPYSDNGYGLCYDSVRSVSSCGSSREQKFGSVWSPSSRDANEAPRTVRSKSLRRRAGNQYYPVSTMKSSMATCKGPKSDAVAEFRQNPVFQTAQWNMKLKLAKRTLKFTPMVWSLALNCSSDIAIGVYRSSVAMYPQYLTQPPGCQRVVMWSFKLEFGIT